MHSGRYNLVVSGWGTVICWVVWKDFETCCLRNALIFVLFHTDIFKFYIVLNKLVFDFSQCRIKGLMKPSRAL